MAIQEDTAVHDASGEMRPLRSHALTLSNGLFDIYERDTLSSVYSPLENGASIREIEATTDDLSGPSLCAHMEEGDAQNELVSTVGGRLLLVLFALQAVEGYKEHLDLPRLSDGENRPGRFDTIYEYLKQHYRGPLLEQYPEVVLALQAALKERGLLNGAYDTAGAPTTLADAAKGLYLVSEARNSLLGELGPAHVGDDPEDHPSVKLIELAARVVLMTIQMITMCRYGSEELADTNMESERVRGIFSRCHLASFEYADEADE